jgi:hypothetical protein
MKNTNENIVSPAMIHHSHVECLRIDPIIVKNGTRSLACPEEQGKRKNKLVPVLPRVPAFGF